MRDRFTAVVLMMAFLWAFQANAGPIGHRPRIWPDFQYQNGGTGSPFSEALDEADDEVSTMNLLFGEIEPTRKDGKAIALQSKKGHAKIPVNAFVFTYGEYLHSWNIPQHQVPRETVVFQEKTFDYRGPPPEPEPSPPIPKEEEQKYRYPKELIEPAYQYPGGLENTFEFEYALRLEKNAANFRYPFAPKDAPAPVQKMYRYGEVSPGTGEGGVAYGPAQRQYGYQYSAGGAGPGYGPGYGVEGELQRRKKEGKKGTGDGSTFKGSPGVSKDRPYGMILLGFGLAAVAALFRMFRLSLFILVGWMVFYGKDVWLIISELQ